MNLKPTFLFDNTLNLTV